MHICILQNFKFSPDLSVQQNIWEIWKGSIYDLDGWFFVRCDSVNWRLSKSVILPQAMGKHSNDEWWMMYILFLTQLFWPHFLDPTFLPCLFYFLLDHIFSHNLWTQNTDFFTFSDFFGPMLTCLDKFFNKFYTDWPILTHFVKCEEKNDPVWTILPIWLMFTNFHPFQPLLTTLDTFYSL